MRYEISSKNGNLYKTKLFGYDIIISTHFLARYNQRNIIKDCTYDKMDVDLSVYDDSMFREIVIHFIENTTYLCIDDKNGKNRKIGCDEGLIYGHLNNETKTIALYTFIPYKLLNDNQKLNFAHLFSNDEKPYSGVIINKSDKEKRVEVYEMILSTNAKLIKDIHKYNEIKKELHEYGAKIVIDIVNDMKKTFNEEIANEFGVFLINKLQNN
jgi:hypothetical protein